jgi:glycine cleavage system H protein
MEEVMDIKEGYFYTKGHEWAKIDGNKARVGITDYAQSKLGDITYVDLPEADREVRQFDVLAAIESVKAASDIYAPLSGKVIAGNADLENAPELVNQSPYEDGWIAEIEIEDASETKNLMDFKAYESYATGLE